MNTLKPLTPTEERLYKLLLPGEPVSVEEFAREMGWWFEGASYEAMARPVRAHVSNLRWKLPPGIEIRALRREGLYVMGAPEPPARERSRQVRWRAARCRYCDAVFTYVTRGASPPYRYCEAHRASTWRSRVWRQREAG